ncbi:MAG: hypothetical protein HYZ53_06385 [Planctomycetes bacterium]|nr:hypothetical protein [Planctomycetota bacterium]
MQVFVNKDDAANVAAIGALLDRLVRENEKQELKGFVVSIGASDEFASIPEKKKLDAIGWMVLDAEGKDSYQHDAAKKMGLNLDPKVKNTIFVYKGKGHTIKTKFVNLKTDDLPKLEEAVRELLKKG